MLITLLLTLALAQVQITVNPGDTIEASCFTSWVNIATAGSTLVGTCEPESPPPPPSTHLVVDHRHVGLFAQIPTQYLAAARELTLLMRHASVGQNISDGLNCLVDNSANSCRTGFGISASLVPVVIQPQYSRSNWVFEFRGNPGWYGKAQDLLNQLGRNFNYITWKQSYVDDPSIVNFWTSNSGPDAYDILLNDADYTSTQVLWWTAAIAKIPFTHITQFNTTMREFTEANQLPLFDLADIESHDLSNVLCSSEGQPIICGVYNVELNGGHLTNGLGKQRVAKAWWVFMAQLAGWRP